ncbi:MAG: nickel pincer cofactor biosynthesis protein LarC [Erysipelotrichaceae bacterium]|nr:nickel pincer cofactor biosynthesis protein LarC [Erysipelotrichaceae bacterium]
MKVLYFDCASGISGNMTLGALLELTGDEGYLLNELNKLHVDGYHIYISKTKKNGITGTYVDVHLEHDHHHEHHHHHEHRNLYDVNHIIDSSDIDEEVKNLAKRIFLRVAKAESKVHNEPLENVHFHEVGAIDSIVDIVGTAILINKIKPDKIYSSIVNDGYGFIECAHGTISVPVPATCEIFADSDAKTRQIDIDTELVTPTGAAIISELACSYGTQPTMNIQKIGWGCGSKDLKIPNVLKVMLGETNNTHKTITVLETNIDDCTGEILGYTSELLFANKALDVFFTPIYMKKNRPAYRLTVSCKNEDVDTIKDIIFNETTTIGIRMRQEQRFVLKREIIEKETEFGKIHFKRIYFNDEIHDYPEYEDLKAIASKENIPLKEIQEKVK